MRQAVATAILSLLPLCAAMGDIYRSVDAQGHVQYSDTPSPGAQLVSSSDLRIRSAAPPACSALRPVRPARRLRRGVSKSVSGSRGGRRRATSSGTPPRRAASNVSRHSRTISSRSKRADCSRPEPTASGSI